MIMKVVTIHTKVSIRATCCSPGWTRSYIPIGDVWKWHEPAVNCRSRACPLCPGISDINLFRYCQSVIDFNAKVSDRTFDLGMP